MAVTTRSGYSAGTRLAPFGQLFAAFLIVDESVKQSSGKDTVRIHGFPLSTASPEDLPSRVTQTVGQHRPFDSISLIASRAASKVGVCTRKRTRLPILLGSAGTSESLFGVYPGLARTRAPGITVSSCGATIRGAIARDSRIRSTRLVDSDAVKAVRFQLAALRQTRSERTRVLPEPMSGGSL